MNYTAFTNKKFNFNQPQGNPTSIKSLRSIINQTKIPLAQYINTQNSNRLSNQKKKIQINNKKPTLNFSYFQKLKGRIVQTAVNHQDNVESFRNVTPIKNEKRSNKFDDSIYNQNQNQNLERNSFQWNQIFSRTINYSNSLHKNRSKSRNNQKSSNDQNKRYSFQPNKNIKTQKITLIPKNTDFVQTNGLNYLPPKPRNKQLVIPSQSFKGQFNNIINHKLKNSQTAIVSDQSRNQMIENIYSHRRMNFLKHQQRRKQMIKYLKKFDKIVVNSHYTELMEKIETNTIEINQVLGTGAYAYVKVGSLKNSNLGSLKLAIKIYEKYKLLEPARKRRVMKQIQILSSMNQQNVIKLFAAYQDKRQIHMLFQHLEDAITLQEYFKHKLHIFQSTEELMFILQQICKGLNYLHSMGIGHRDIKPENILLSFKNKNPTVKIIDFGFAINSAQSKTQCGTPNFMAPQLFSKNSYSTYASDMWSFGVMIYYLFQGKYPFKGYNQNQLIKSITKNQVVFYRTNQFIQNIILCLLQKNFEIRINSANLLDWFELQRYS